jgi:hypothetical protein
VRVLQFFAIVLTALALVPGGAHLFELPNKIGLSPEHYYVVQSIYRGWALFGAVITAAIIVNLATALMLWGRGKPFWPSVAAGLILAGTLIIFFEWTYPANQATDNWTALPPDWEALRRQWEWSHAANAVLTFIALCCATVSAMKVTERSSPPSQRAAVASMPRRSGS